MDPFSITVGVVTLAAGFGAAGKTARKFLDLRNVPREILQMAAEIDESEIIISRARNAQERLSRQETSVAYAESLSMMIPHAEAAVVKLRDLLQNLLRGDQDLADLSAQTTATESIEFSKLKWLKREKEALRLCAEIGELKEKLCKEMAAASYWATLEVYDYYNGERNHWMRSHAGEMQQSRHSPAVGAGAMQVRRRAN